MTGVASTEPDDEPLLGFAIWLRDEYFKAQLAARQAAAPIFHASAVSRMCALGEVAQHLNSLIKEAEESS